MCNRKRAMCSKNCTESGLSSITSCVTSQLSLVHSLAIGWFNIINKTCQLDNKIMQQAVLHHMVPAAQYDVSGTL